MHRWSRKLLHRVIDTPWLFYGMMVAIALPVFFNDWDVLRRLATFDAIHQGWFVDEIVTFVIILGVAATLRRAIVLRWEVCRRQMAETEATLLARHDPLTGLPNRRLLQETMTEAIGALRPGGTCAAMIVDLDGFKAVNDLHGHAVGDALLCEVVERLSALAEHGITLARLGGDEFAALLPAELAREEVARVADLIIASLAEPFHISDQRVEIGASVGVAVAPADGDTMPALLRAADVALYRAKQGGRGGYRFFEPNMDHLMREQTALKAELRQALATGQIVPFYQPTIDMATGAVDGLEVLARWQHPTRGLLAPDMFIPLAEDLRLMSALTVTLFKQVCQDARQWPDDCRIAINVSPSQLHDTEIGATLAALIAQAGLRPSRFEIEVTETALIQDVATARHVIDGFRAHGLTVALDDFGTGYSSLYHLREITFDKVKIDRSFVRGIATDPIAARYVEAIIRLVTSLDLKVTAEGIEDADVFDRLIDLGCSFGQGFMFSRPVAAAEVSATLKRLSVSDMRSVSDLQFLSDIQLARAA